MERGNDVSVVDLFGASPKDLEERADHYLQGKSILHYVDTPEVRQTDLFILYAMSYMSHHELLSIAHILRASRPDAKIAVLENSQSVTAYALPLLAKDFFKCGVDALLCGEVYWNWDGIASYLENPKRNPVPENVLIPTSLLDRAVHRRIEKSPGYPIPAWELFPLENYWSIPYSHGPKTSRFLPVLTSRGCPFPCDFCVVPETNNVRWRGRNPEEVVNEMIALRDRYQVRHFQIEDLNPTVKSSRWDEICRLLIERDAGIFFYFVSGTKAETIRLDQVPLLAQAGCRYISISPESGSAQLLRAIGKPVDYAHGLKLVEACQRHGINTQACFLVGHPSETTEDHLLSCNYLRTLVQAGLDEVAVFIVAPLAGSALHSKGNIEIASSESLLSFSPKGRRLWMTLSDRRRQLIRIFFMEKLKKGSHIWLQGFRALWGRPQTKMENLPWRAAFIYWLILRHWFHRTIGRLFVLDNTSTRI
jgi:radical SAM superfamily enzyme YgiQ (UPF0313 family)